MTRRTFFNTIALTAASAVSAIASNIRLPKPKDPSVIAEGEIRTCLPEGMAVMVVEDGVLKIKRKPNA